MVIKPFSISKLSLSTFARGARQLVVHDPLEMMLWPAGSYFSSFTPSTTVKSASLPGALMITFFAPAVRCFEAPALSVKKPVHSITKSTSISFQGSFSGSLSFKTL